jgi:hypothetical protein
MWRAQGHEVLRRAGRLVTTWRFREAVKTRMLRRDTLPETVRRALEPTFADDLARLASLLPPSTRLPEWLAPARGSRVP